jgi:dUTP pyrophosphatase
MRKLIDFFLVTARETYTEIPAWVQLTLLATIGASGIFWGFGFFSTLAAMAVVGFFQNMAFTAVSRSRNAGDPEYHRKCAWGSNGIWLVCQLFIWKHLWLAFSTGVFVQLVPLILVYVIATTEGSVAMMKQLLRKEKGKRKVGSNTIEVKIDTDYYDRCAPVRGTPGAAGFDLFLDIDPKGDNLTIDPDEVYFLPTGCRFEIPEGHVGLIFARSSLVANGLRIANGVGVVDSDYRGEVKILIENIGDVRVNLASGQRLAQIIFLPVPDVLFTFDPELSETVRGDGGFGSTGA